MDLAAATARADALALAEEASQVPGFRELHVEPAAAPHPVVAGSGLLVDIREAEADPASGAPRYDVVLHHGSLQGGEDAWERALLFGLERVAERAAADEAIPDDEALFQAHARFVRGLDVPAAWYRRGEGMGPSAWAVDLDVFVDLVVSREAWATLAAGLVTLTVLGDELELEVPEDADPDEAWSLEGGGLFEPSPGIDDEELAEDDGRYGDLHVIPYVY